MDWNFDRPELVKDKDGFYPGERTGIPDFLRLDVKYSAPATPVHPALCISPAAILPQTKDC